jgi:hypothetical protein
VTGSLVNIFVTRRNVSSWQNFTHKIQNPLASTALVRVAFQTGPQRNNIFKCNDDRFDVSTTVQFSTVVYGVTRTLRPRK